MVVFLLDQRGMKASDLWLLLGSKSRTSELLSGKREVGKDQAKKLAALPKEWAMKLVEILARGLHKGYFQPDDPREKCFDRMKSRGEEETTKYKRLLNRLTCASA